MAKIHTIWDADKEILQMAFEIIWPERRLVSEDQIKLWFSDALVNGMTDRDDLNDNVEAMARELHNIGIITLKGKAGFR